MSDHYAIILVDDDEFLLDMYTLKFTQAGHTVESFASVAAALERLRTGTPVDAVVTDSVMPGIDGLTLVETIKKEKLGGTPAVVMLSNQGQDADLAEAKARGVDGYIIKATAVPTDVLNQVVDIIQETADRRTK
jgi:two-component system OmpR family response regulator